MSRPGPARRPDVERAPRTPAYPETALECGIVPFWCPVVLLIDGYNLLHAAGLAAANLPPGRLRSARRRMLDWLADAAPARGAVVRVVFDGMAAPAESPEADHRGVRVRFAFRQTADDLIETLLAGDARPADVTVVSNDSRLHEAARRRGSRAWSCERFMDWLTADIRPATPTPPAEEKPPLSAAEAADLLRAFERPKPRRR